MARYQPRTRDDEGQLVQAMLQQVKQHPRYGYRRIGALLRAGGWSVNRKRIYRLWKHNGLKVPVKQHKKRRVGTSDNSCTRQCATHQNHVWAWDFIFDRTSNGRSIKWLSVIDEYTRECLALEVERSMTAGDVLNVLIELTALCGVPGHIRSDNGPEFIAKAIRSWLTTAKINALYIEPGSPWQNGYAESFGSKLRDELLNAEVFENVPMAKALGLAWRLDYNHRRPHSSLGYRTPAAFAASLAEPPVAPLPPAQPAKQQVILS
jgi:transposase InsO family protein